VVVCLGLCGGLGGGSLPPPLLASFRGVPLLFFLCLGRCCFLWWSFGSIFSGVFSLFGFVFVLYLVLPLGSLSWHSFWVGDLPAVLFGLSIDGSVGVSCTLVSPLYIYIYMPFKKKIINCW